MSSPAPSATAGPPLAGPAPRHGDAAPGEQAGGAEAAALRDELVSLLTGGGGSLPAFQGPSSVQLEPEAGEQTRGPCLAGWDGFSVLYPLLAATWVRVLGAACMPAVRIPPPALLMPAAHMVSLTLARLGAVSTSADDGTLHVRVSTAALYRALA